MPVAQTTLIMMDIKPKTGLNRHLWVNPCYKFETNKRQSKMVYQVPWKLNGMNMVNTLSHLLG